MVYSRIRAGRCAVCRGCCSWILLSAGVLRCLSYWWGVLGIVPDSPSCLSCTGACFTPYDSRKLKADGCWSCRACIACRFHLVVWLRKSCWVLLCFCHWFGCRSWFQRILRDLRFEHSSSFGMWSSSASWRCLPLRWVIAVSMFSLGCLSVSGCLLLHWLVRWSTCWLCQVKQILCCHLCGCFPGLVSGVSSSWR